MTLSSTPESIQDDAQQLLEARRYYLQSQSTREIARRLGYVASRWMDPDYEFRLQATAEMVDRTGFPAEMVSWGIESAFRPLLPPGLARLVQAELGGFEVLDGFVTGQRRRSLGPELTTHVLAGTIVTPGLWSICFGLLLKSGNLVKCSSQDPVFPALFAESLKKDMPDFGECVRVRSWSRDDAEVTSAAVGASDTVVAFGDDETIRAFQELVQAPRRFIGHGHRVSLAVVAEEAFDTETAEGLARDTAFYDQQGCLSPHVVYLVGDKENSNTFCKQIAVALDEMESKFPRRSLSSSEAANIQQLRSAFEMRAAAGDDARMWKSEDSTAWTLLYDEQPPFEVSCLNRVLYAKRLNNLAQLNDALSPVRGWIQGVAAKPSGIVESVAELTADSGVSRICAPGELQHPPLTWHEDGESVLLPFIRWVGIEE